MRRRTMKARRPPEVRWEIVAGGWDFVVNSAAMDRVQAVKLSVTHCFSDTYYAAVRCYFSGVKSITFNTFTSPYGTYYRTDGIRMIGPDETIDKFKLSEILPLPQDILNSTTFTVNDTKEHWVDIAYLELSASQSCDVDVYISAWEPA